MESANPTKPFVFCPTECRYFKTICAKKRLVSPARATMCEQEEEIAGGIINQMDRITEIKQYADRLKASGVKFEEAFIPPDKFRELFDCYEVENCGDYRKLYAIMFDVKFFTLEEIKCSK